MDDEEDTSYGGGGADPFSSGLGALFQAVNSTTPEAQDQARSILKRDLEGDDDFGESKVLDKMSQNAEKARQALEAAKQRLLAQRMDPGQKWLTLGAALGSPTRSGRWGEQMGNVANALSGYKKEEQELENRKSQGELELDQAISGVDQGLLSSQMSLANLKRQSRAKLDAEALKILGKRTGAGSGLQVPIKAMEAVDREFAKDYVPFIQGGAADAVKGLTDLGQAQKALESKAQGKPGAPNLTGPWISLLPKMMRDRLAPDSANVQELVEYTVQRSLRPILGAQFTKDEGEKLISRVFNPALDESINAQRLSRLIQQLNRAYEQKQAAAKYYEKHHTLGGFHGRTSWTRQSIEDDMGTLPGDPDYEDESASPDETPPASGNTPPRKVVKFSTLAKARGGKVKFADGGAVETDDIEMPDGTIVPNVPRGSTQSEVMAIIEQQKAGNRAPYLQKLKSSLNSLRESVPFDPMSGGEAMGETALAGLVAKYGVGALQRGSDLLPGRRITKSEKPILGSLEADQLSPEDVADRIRALRKRGVPATVASEGGPGLEALTESALSRPNSATPEAIRQLAATQAGSRGRVEERINQSLIPDNYFDQEKKLIQERSDIASPLYDAANKQFSSVDSPGVFKLMDTPSGKTAVERAIDAIQDKPGATIGKVDALGMVQKPSLEFLNQVKIELDDMIKKEEGSGMNYQATAKGKRIRDLRDSFVSELDKATTVKGKSMYGDARASWQEGSKKLEALQLGYGDYLKMDPDQLTDVVQKMSHAEREHLRTGVAQKLFGMIRNPTTDLNAAQKIIGSPGMESRLALLFDKPKDFEIFKAALQGESRLFDQTKSALKSGKGARRLASGPQRVSGTKLSAAEAIDAGTSPLRWGMKFLQSKSKPEIPDKAMPDLIKLLQSGDQASLDEFVTRLGPKYGRAAARAATKGKAGRVGMLAGAAAALYEAMKGEQEEPPPEEEPKPAGYARGGRVSRKLARLRAAVEATRPEGTLDGR